MIKYFQHPQALLGAYPEESVQLFLHVIQMKPNYPMPSDNDNRNLVFYNLLASRNTYGILSTKKLPEIPSFPIFMNVGDLQISLKTNIPTPSLASEEIHSLRQFHWLVFTDILPLTKEFMIFDPANKENSFLIVPGKNETVAKTFFN